MDSEACLGKQSCSRNVNPNPLGASPSRRECNFKFSHYKNASQQLKVCFTGEIVSNVETSKGFLDYTSNHSLGHTLQ